MPREKVVPVKKNPTVNQKKEEKEEKKPLVLLPEQKLIPDHFEMFDNVHLLRYSVDCLVARYYDLFPFYPVEWKISVVREAVKDSFGYYGPRIETQQCHWYDKRGTDEGRHDREYTRCKKSAIFYPFFCVVHADQVYKNLEVKTSSLPAAGMGLFARMPLSSFDSDQPSQASRRLVFSAGSVIAPYYGRVFEAADMPPEVRLSSYAYYMNEPDWTLRVNLEERHLFDATGTQSSSIARYANHGPATSDDPRVPVANCEIVPLTEPTDEIMDKTAEVEGCEADPVVLPWLCAKRDVYEGEELLFNYGRSYSFTKFAMTGLETRI